MILPVDEQTNVSTLGMGRNNLQHPSCFFFSRGSDFCAASKTKTVLAVASLLHDQKNHLLHPDVNTRGFPMPHFSLNGVYCRSGWKGEGRCAGLGDSPTSEEIPCSSSVINHGRELEEEDKIADGSFLRWLHADGVNVATYFITAVPRISLNHLIYVVSSTSLTRFFYTGFYIKKKRLHGNFT